MPADHRRKPEASRFRPSVVSMMWIRAHGSGSTSVNWVYMP
jgi:hypothetical protein